MLKNGIVGGSIHVPEDPLSFITFYSSRWTFEPNNGRNPLRERSKLIWLLKRGDNIGLVWLIKQCTPRRSRTSLLQRVAIVLWLKIEHCKIWWLLFSGHKLVPGLCRKYILIGTIICVFQNIYTNQTWKCLNLVTLNFIVQQAEEINTN